jgi:hypothetical protein
MKQKNVQYAIAGVIVVIGIILIAVSQSNKKPAAAVPGQPQENAQVTVQNQPTASPTKTPAKSSPLPSPGTNYTAYVTQLALATAACKESATTQFNKLYASEQGSAFQSMYNSNSGVCYMRATGAIQAAYSTTTTSYIYFRNVTRNTLLAQCTDTLSQTFSDNEWQCTDKTTGQTIPKAQFTAIIAEDTTK